MKFEVELDDILFHVFDNTSDEKLQDLYELLWQWQDRVGEEIEFINRVEAVNE